MALGVPVIVKIALSPLQIGELDVTPLPVKFGELGSDKTIFELLFPVQPAKSTTKLL